MLDHRWLLLSINFTKNPPKSLLRTFRLKPTSWPFSIVTRAETLNPKPYGNFSRLGLQVWDLKFEHWDRLPHDWDPQSGCRDLSSQKGFINGCLREGKICK